MAKSRREACVECRGDGKVCSQCGASGWDDYCMDCDGKMESCYACGGEGGFEMPTANAARDAKYFASPEETQRLREEAIAEAEAGKVVAAPILGFTPTDEEETEPEPLRWSTASRDVLFVPNADGRERVLLTEPGSDEGDEVELPSKQIYRGRAALSPTRARLAVGSPTSCRRVEIESGESRVVLQGPWQIGVAWLDEEIVAVLTQGGDWKLEFDDPDVADMPAVKQFPKGTQKHATMRTPGMLHVVDTRGGSDLRVSVHVNANHLETLRDGRVLVLRREPPDERSWGTLFMRHDDGRLTSIAKLPIDIGEVSEDEGTIRGAAGFEVLGLDVEGARTAGHRKIDEGLAVEEQPPPPKDRIGVPQSGLRFERRDVERPETPRELHDRFDWIEKHQTDGKALGAHKEGEGEHRYFVYDVAAEREIAIEPTLVRENIEYEWAGDGSRLIAWADRNVWEITPAGARRTIVEAAGPVTCAAPLLGGRVAVLYRFKETDGELDVYDAEGRLEACVPLHPFDRVWSLHGGKVVIVGHKNPDTELAQVHVLAVRPAELSVRVGSGREGCLRFVAKQNRFGSKMMMPVKQVWDVDGIGHLELVTGGVYRVEGDVDEMADRFGPVPRLDHRTGSDLFLDQGYIDEQGQWLTDPIWKGVDDWQGGRGRVHFSGQGQIALTDEEGRVLTPPCFSEIHRFSQEGVASVSVGGVRGKGAKCGMIDRDGRWVLAPEHDFVGDVEDGHARVQNAGRWSLYAASGERVAGDFSSAGNFAFDLAFATSDGQRGGFLRPDGSWAFEGEVVDSYPFAEIGLAGAKLASGKWAFVDREGRVLDARYDALFPHKAIPDGWRAPVQVGDAWGYVDETGELVIEPRFTRAYNFAAEGIAPVQVTSTRWSYVDADGNLLDEDEKGWERTFTVYEGVGWFKQSDGKLGAIHVGGSIIAEDVDAIRDFHEGYAAIRRGDRWGIINTRGEVVVEPRFQDAAASRELLIGVKENDAWGFLGRDWEWAIEPAFRSVGRFQEGRARAQTPT